MYIRTYKSELRFRIFSQTWWNNVWVYCVSTESTRGYGNQFVHNNKAIRIPLPAISPCSFSLLYMWVMRQGVPKEISAYLYFGKSEKCIPMTCWTVWFILKEILLVLIIKYSKKTMLSCITPQWFAFSPETSELKVILLMLETQYSGFGGQYDVCCCPGSLSRQGISRHGIGSIGQATLRSAPLWIRSSSV